jgi:hypothetical protein
MKQNLFCKWFGHKFIESANNNLYTVRTCIRCGAIMKLYHHKEDTNVIKRIRY